MGRVALRAGRVRGDQPTPGEEMAEPVAELGATMRTEAVAAATRGAASAAAAAAAAGMEATRGAAPAEAKPAMAAPEAAADAVRD